MITIGFDDFPFDPASNLGPAVFTRRLGQELIRQGLARLVPPGTRGSDIDFFKIQAPPRHPNPFALRVDGIYFDTACTLGDSTALNRPIFDSIDRADGIVFISEFSRRLVTAFHPAAGGKTHAIIHNAVDTALFTPAGPDLRGRLGFAPGDLVLVASAKWRRWKRLRETIDLFHMARGSFAPGAKLLVLGGHPDHVVEDPDIRYAGEIPAEELPCWYRTGNAYIHLATLEACGNTQVEAMACGLPVLCVNNGGIGETVVKACGGIISHCDKPYDFTPIDHYNPPPPDFNTLLVDLRRLLTNLPEFSRAINRDSLDIGKAASHYAGFLTELARTRPPSLRRAFAQTFRNLFRRDQNQLEHPPLRRVRNPPVLTTNAT